MPRATLLAMLLLIPAASAGHGFYLNDPGAAPGPADISYLRWETDGERTQVEFTGNDMGDAERHVVVLVGRPGGVLQGHVRADADGNESGASSEGVGVEAVEWEHRTRLTVHWQPALAPKTCVLVVAWVGAVEDVVPDAAAGSLDDVDALWDEGRACSHRDPLSYEGECGHPDIPAYCSPGPAWSAVPLLLVFAAVLHRRVRA